MRTKMLIDAGGALVRLLPPEAAHRVTLELLALAAPLLPAAPPDDPRLGLTLLGHRFPNPIGLAAGFDKDACVPDAMLRLGFGFVECGTVTPLQQRGNPKPRLFRLKDDRAVINRMGFNNAGMERMAARVAARKWAGVVGINIGANKDSPDRANDYRLAFARLARFAAYVAVNVSSPNTPGLRGLQRRDELERLLALLVDERRKLGRRVPLLLKIAPDINEAMLDDIASVALASGIEGLIVSNTTIARPASLKSAQGRETGGLSGKPLFRPSTALLRAAHARAGSRLVLVGVGGVASGADAYEKIRAGASLVQLYTAIAYDGMGLLRKIKLELAALLARDGFADIAAAVGTTAR